MINDDDPQDTVNAAARQLVVEIQQLAAVTTQFNKKIGQHSPEEMLSGLVNIMAQNTTVTISLSTLVMTHVQATGMLQKEITFHS